MTLEFAFRFSLSYPEGKEGRGQRQLLVSLFSCVTFKLLSKDSYKGLMFFEQVFFHYSGNDNECTANVQVP